MQGGSSTTYSFRAPSPGRYPFRCDPHPFMNGTVEFR
ncbi:MAG: plastocyanin/azurin family copper-binding protein [Actinomycetota bacterium]